MITKQTEGGTIPDHCWYYMLAWNDQNNFHRMDEWFGTKGLRQLTEEQFWKLFKYAAEVDLTGKKIAV